MTGIPVVRKTVPSSRGGMTPRNRGVSHLPSAPPQRMGVEVRCP
jgi:hypothetical protein